MIDEKLLIQKLRLAEANKDDRAIALIVAKIKEGRANPEPSEPAQIEVVEQQEPSNPLIDNPLIGGLSAAATVGSSAAGEIAGGLTALVDVMNPFTDNDPTKTIESIQDKFRIPPTERGQAAFDYIGRKLEPLSGIINYVKEFKDRAGADALDKTKSPAIATFVSILPDIALELSPAKLLSTPAKQGFKPNKTGKNADIPEQLNAEIAGTQAAQETGIDLFKAQKTLNPTDIERQAFVSQLPSGAAKARRELSIQNAQSAEAVDRVLESIAPPNSITDAGARFRTAAEKSVEKIKAIRSEYSSPIYKQAFRRQRQGKTELINTDNLELKINKMAAQFDGSGEISKNLNSAAAKIKNANGDLQKLHHAKLELQQKIDSYGENSLGNTTKRYMTDVITDLTDDLTSQSPSYRAAKSEFARLSPDVDAMVDSPIGRASKLDDLQLKQLSKQVFDPSETDTNVIKNAKKTIKDIDPDAWDMLLRSELQRRMGRMRSDLGELSQSASTENVPSQLYNSIYGNEKSRRVLYEAATPEVRKKLKYLETALKRASKGRPGGSQTGVRAEISKEMRGGIIQSIRNLVRSPIDTTLGVGEEAAFNKRVSQMADVLFDPSWNSDWDKLRNLEATSSKAGEIFDKMLRESKRATGFGIIINPSNEEEGDN